MADGYGSHYVLQYDAKGSVQGYFGGVGSASGKFQTPHGIWCDNRPGRTPALVVCDRANARLQYFSARGEYLGGVDDVLFPADIDTRGSVMVVPDLHARITLFDKANQVISHLGDDPQWRQKVLADDLALRRQPQRWENGRVIHPHDACFDSAGNLYVAEWEATGRINFLRHVG